MNNLKISRNAIAIIPQDLTMKISKLDIMRRVIETTWRMAMMKAKFLEEQRWGRLFKIFWKPASLHLRTVPIFECNIIRNTNYFLYVLVC